MNLKQQIADLRTQNNRLVARRAEKTQKEAKKHRLLLSQRADGMIRQVYEELDWRIAQSAGLGDRTTLALTRNCITDPGSYGWSEEDGTTVQALIKERCGLNLVPVVVESKAVLEVNLRDKVKPCYVTQDDKATLLNFPALLAENQRRNRVWKKTINKIAQDVIDVCRSRACCMDGSYRNCLGNYLNVKYYGIPDEVTISSDGWGSFQFDTQSSGSGCVLSCKYLHYADLTEERLNELEAAANAVLSGGEIKLYRRREGTRWKVQAKLRRRPEKVVGSPYCDYEAYCKTYDVVTEPLQTVFDKLIAGLKPTDAEEQITALCPVRVLEFDFADCEWGRDLVFACDAESNFAMISQGLTKGRHGRNFFAAVEKVFPTIRVRQMTFAKAKDASRHDELRLEYRIVKKRDDFTCQQLETEQMIRFIKSQKVNFIAREVVNVLLDEVEKTGLEYLFKNDYPQRNYCRVELTEIKLTGKAAGHTINLTKVTQRGWLDMDVNEEFITRVEREVNRLTDGVILVDIRLRYFQLNFDRDKSSAESPMTLRELS